MSAMIRALGAEDAAAAARIHASAFPDPWPAEDLARLFTDVPTAAFGIFDGDVLGGFILLSLVAPEAEILTLCVDPTRQRAGSGFALMRHAMTLLAGQAFTRIFLDVARQNIAARALYAKAGFAETGLRKAYYRNGDDAILMDRAL